MDALRAEAGVRTPRVLPASNGERVVTLTDEASGEERYCVMFEFLPGIEPLEQDSLSASRRLARSPPACTGTRGHWQRPTGFARFHWDYDAAFGSEAPGGDAGRRASGSARPSGRCSGGSTRR